jgi:prevent-host-death family protein
MRGMTAEHAELPIDPAGIPVDVARRVVRDGEVIYLTDHGTRAAAVVPASMVDELESARETLEILADPEAAAGLNEGIADADAGRVQPLEDVLEELRAADRP